MTTESNFSSEIGKQKGSFGPLTGSFVLLMLIGLCFPSSLFAASNSYLALNANTFIDKIRSEYGEMVNIAALLHDADERLIMSVIVVESEGNELAVSNRGAQGLMQLMPGTAKAMGAKDSKDPFQNILAGTKYLKHLQSVYGFTRAESLVAYNMGPSRAKRWLSQYNAEDYGYVKKVMYVYGVITEEDKSLKNLARVAQTRMVEAVTIDTSIKPLLTRPRTIALEQLPVALSDGRRPSEVASK